MIQVRKHTGKRRVLAAMIIDYSSPAPRQKGMGTEWDQEVVGNVDPQKRVLCLAQGFLRG